MHRLREFTHELLSVFLFASLCTVLKIIRKLIVSKHHVLFYQRTVINNESAIYVSIGKAVFLFGIFFQIEILSVVCVFRSFPVKFKVSCPVLVASIESVRTLSIFTSGPPRKNAFDECFKNHSPNKK